MSASGAFAASSRIGVACGVSRFSPARERNSPMAVWVRLSMGNLHCRRRGLPHRARRLANRRVLFPMLRIFAFSMLAFAAFAQERLPMQEDIWREYDVYRTRLLSP